VVAEFVAGTAGQSSGLASRIIEAGYRLNAPRLFAALILISLTGIHDLSGAVMDFSSRAAPLARERAQTGALSDIA
jgi:ABC-type nitrate/sulfonate/bicarbonate transport system permease component